MKDSVVPVTSKVVVKRLSLRKVCLEEVGVCRGRPVTGRKIVPNGDIESFTNGLSGKVRTYMAGSTNKEDFASFQDFFSSLQNLRSEPSYNVTLMSASWAVMGLFLTLTCPQSVSMVWEAIIKLSGPWR